MRSVHSSPSTAYRSSNPRSSTTTRRFRGVAKKKILKVLDLKSYEARDEAKKITQKKVSGIIKIRKKNISQLAGQLFDSSL